MSRPIRKLLIANRGEIAVRIIRTCREMGIKTVAVYSDPDNSAMHVLQADEAYPLKGSRASETYLDQAKILSIAQKSSSDAIHPGYGFLSENPGFADAVSSAGLTFVGPPAASMRLLGDKTAARALAKQLGVPIVEGTEVLVELGRAMEGARRLGFPVLIKAAAGGGGKGMRVVHSQEDFPSAFDMAQSEALNAFGDSRLFLEQYIEAPHHVEIQILADAHGKVLYLGERDCSVQRRHQKVIEESPSPVMTPELRRQMGEAAVLLAREAGYVNAGTVEFLVDRSGRFSFLEVNTRLQVEHPVTELLTRLDLVREQIRIAQGERLDVLQDEIRLEGHAIECRVYAEDPFNGFMPSTGELLQYVPPSGPFVRVDSGAREGDLVSVHYDPLLAKVLTWAPSRQRAIKTMKRALREFRISGVVTTIPFCQSVLDSQVFLEGHQNTQFVDRQFNWNSLRTFSDTDLFEAALGAVLVKEFASRQEDESPGTASEESRWRQGRRESYR